MVPGILVILVTMVGAFLAALNIVKEKEIGAIELINVTPIRKHQFILGKLIPFWVLGLVVFPFGCSGGCFMGLSPEGSLLTVYLFAVVYLLAILGQPVGLHLYGTQSLHAYIVFMMMVFILLGGLYTSIDSMPRWAQIFTVQSRDVLLLK